MAQTQEQGSTIAAFFEDGNSARRAVEALHGAGFSSAHIGVAHRGRYGSTSTTTGTATGSTTHESVKEHAFTTWDKVKNWFAGDEPEAYENERPRGDLGGHEVVDPDAAYGYDASDLHGSFRTLDVPEEQSRYFSHRLGSGSDGAVVTVITGSRRAEAEAILSRYGADFGANAAGYNYADMTPAETTPAVTAATAGLREDVAEETVPTGSRRTGFSEDETPENIQLLGEVLRVHKDRVSRGEVRIRKEVITENQTIQVPVTREELVIERHAGHEGAAATGTIGESEIRIPLSEERATLDKETVVREEVSVSKRPVQDVQDVTGEVRREELVVDDAKGNTDPNRRIA